MTQLKKELNDDLIDIIVFYSSFFFLGDLGLD